MKKNERHDGFKNGERARAPVGQFGRRALYTASSGNSMHIDENDEQQCVVSVRNLPSFMGRRKGKSQVTNGNTANSSNKTSAPMRSRAIKNPGSSRIRYALTVLDTVTTRDTLVVVSIDIVIIIIIIIIIIIPYVQIDIAGDGIIIKPKRQT